MTDTSAACATGMSIETENDNAAGVPSSRLLNWHTLTQGATGDTIALFFFTSLFYFIFIILRIIKWLNITILCSTG